MIRLFGVLYMYIPHAPFKPIHCDHGTHVCYNLEFLFA
jgi:hypothetical protein